MLAVIFLTSKMHASMSFKPQAKMFQGSAPQRSP